MTEHNEELLNNIIFSKFIDTYQFYQKCITFKKTVELRPSPIHGLGLFAKEDIKKDTYITFYPVHVLYYNNNYINLTDKDISYEEIADYCVGQNPYSFKFYASPKLLEENNYGHMINHSYNNNALLYGWPKCIIKTNVDISKDTEITINYTEKYWNTHNSPDYEKHKKKTIIYLNYTLYKSEEVRRFLEEINKTKENFNKNILNFIFLLESPFVNIKKIYAYSWE